jgi:hypothetical protein
VVFHGAELNYLPAAQREEFTRLMSACPEVIWISNEGAGVIPSITEQVDVEINGRTIVAVNGQAVALGTTRAELPRHLNRGPRAIDCTRSDRFKRAHRALSDPVATDLALAGRGSAVSVAHEESHRLLGMSAAARLLQQV